MCWCLKYPHTVRRKRKQYCQHPRHHIGNQLIDPHGYIKYRISSNADNKSQPAKKQIQQYFLVFFIKWLKDIQYRQSHHPVKNISFLLHSSFPLLLLYCLNAILSIAKSLRKYKDETILPIFINNIFSYDRHVSKLFL